MPLRRLQHHPGQYALHRSRARFNVCHAARRSGKTEIAKLRMAEAIGRWGTKRWQQGLIGRFMIGAPTLAQVKRIYLEDMRRVLEPILVEPPTMTPYPVFRTVNGVELSLMGLDRPERVEGSPIHRALLDEYANCKPETWTDHLRPALSTRGQLGSADFIGTPEGRNHYYRLVQRAHQHIEERTATEVRPDWAVHHWPASDIIPEEAEAARRDLDPLTWQQEYGGEFVSARGRAYYQYDDALHRGPLWYVPGRSLMLAFDFNWRPGVAVIAQQIQAPHWLRERIEARGGRVADEILAVIGEVFLRENSNTQRVAEQIVERWSETHRGEVQVYGDPAGQQNKSGQLAGTDWEIVERVLGRVPHWQVRLRVPRAAPLQRRRLNATNSVMLSDDGTVAFAIDARCLRMRDDLEGVRVDDEGSIIEKESGSDLTHLSDALGYLIHERKFGGAQRAAVYGGLV